MDIWIWQIFRKLHLPFIGLYNEAAQQGFSSAVKEGSAPVTEETSDIDAELAETESKAAELQGRIDSALTQEDINILSGELYRLWDDELNSIWGRLKAILPADTMEQLTDEEIAWIEEKEAAVAAAGREAAGGSMQPMLGKLKGIGTDKSQSLCTGRISEIIIDTAATKRHFVIEMSLLFL